MKLSELTKELQRLNRLAKKSKIDPEVMIVVSPSFPILATLRDEIYSTLDGELKVELNDNKHMVFLAEHKEEGELFGEVVEKFGLV